MPITGCRPVAVVDLHQLPVAALPARDADLAVRCGAHRVAGLGLHVQSRMHGGRPKEGVHALAETRREIEIAGERLADRYGAERTCQAFGLNACGAGANDLAIEIDGLE